MDAEIMQVVAEEARESYAEEIGEGWSEATAKALCSLAT